MRGWLCFVFFLPGLSYWVGFYSFGFHFVKVYAFWFGIYKDGTSFLWLGGWW